MQTLPATVLAEQATESCFDSLVPAIQSGLPCCVDHDKDDQIRRLRKVSKHSHPTLSELVMLLE